MTRKEIEDHFRLVGNMRTRIQALEEEQREEELATQEELAQAQAGASEMRLVLQKVEWLKIGHLLHCPVCWRTPAQKHAWNPPCALGHALSSDAGKGILEKVERLEKALLAIVKLADYEAEVDDVPVQAWEEQKELGCIYWKHNPDILDLYESHEGADLEP